MLLRASETVAAETNNNYYDVGGINAIIGFFNNIFNFKGKSTRREFWWMKLWTTLVEVVVSSILFVQIFNSPTQLLKGHLGHLNDSQDSAWMGLLGFWLVFILWISVPSLAMGIRRYRDAGIPWGIYIVLRYIVCMFYVTFLVFALNGADWKILLLAIATDCISQLPTLKASKHALTTELVSINQTTSYEHSKGNSIKSSKYSIISALLALFIVVIAGYFIFSGQRVIGQLVLGIALIVGILPRLLRKGSGK